MKKKNKNFKFKHFLECRGYTLAKVADILDITRVSIYNKIAGNTPFTIREVAIIRKHFNLTAEETLDMFM